MTDQPKGLDNGLTNYGDLDFARFLRRSFARSMGLSRELLNKPVVGIAMTPSGFNNCHRYMPELVEAVSRGVLVAGALPRPFPTISLGEVFLNPTSMMYRNLMSMDTEEARARSTRTRSRPWRVASRSLPAPARSWAPPRPWPAPPR